MQGQQIRIALIGASGAMGREIENLAPSEGVSITHRFDDSHPLPEVKPDADFDVAIDFTLPNTVITHIERVLAWGKPIVVGTTGWLNRLDEVQRLVDEKQGRLIWAGNFSVGVQSFFQIVRLAASIFNRLQHYDVAVHEEHHTRKADSPSGTANSLASIILEEIERKSHRLNETAHTRIDPNALHVTSGRIGSTVGMHRVTFDSEADTIELVHRAKNRSGFALGALMASKMILSLEPGSYKFDDLFGHSEQHSTG